jgi:capsular exopolysaccharide synthesis family protein
LDKPLKRILITSGGPGEGKTLTAVNLSISIAREGKKVLLMDTDLRRSMVHKHFNISAKVGVTNVLLGEKDIKDAIFKTELEGLFVMPAGPVPVDPARLLESLKMHQLIAGLAEKFDTIVLDTAPTLVLDDAVILSQHTDGVVIVVESGRATVQAVTQMEEIFRLAKATLLGAVLNKQKTLRGTSDYYRYYKYYAKSEKSTRERKA